MAEITNEEVITFTAQMRPIAEALTVLKAAIRSRGLKFDTNIGPKIAAFDDSKIKEGRAGISDVNAYQLGLLNTTLRDVLAVLDRAGVDDTLETFCVREFENRTFKGQ